jgi:hypothetical protein
MALSISTQVSPVGNKLVVETSAGATANNSVLGAAGKVYAIDVDNSLNGAACYLKMYENAAPTVGTTAPDLIFPVKTGQRRGCVIPEGLDFTVLSFACVTTPGNAGVVAPTQPVTVRLVCSVP